MMTRKFTGKHMAAILVTGFGVVFAVNFTMATLANTTFGGVVVENSYVASQKFNGWLADADRVEKLGWTIETGRTADGKLAVTAIGVPGDVHVNAIARHPLGREDDRSLTFVPAADGRFVSRETLPAGRWTLRLKVISGDDVWRGERRLQ